MCLIVMAYRCRSDYPLIVAANRDEFYARPTQPLDFWPEPSGVLAGRDLKAGGTWMGLHRNGRLAAITNYREPERFRPEAPSRGHLVSDFLVGHREARAYLDTLHRNAPDYNGFNLIAGRVSSLFYFGNRGSAPRPVEAGIHALSNHLLDTPWPKIRRTRRAMADIAEREAQPHPEALMALLQDRHIPPDEELPATGIGLEWERLLAPAFIQSPTYGTRSSSVLLVAASGRTQFIERTFTPEGRASTRSFELQLRG